MTKKRSILVADDDPSILSMLSRMLAEKGFDVKTASDGYTALKIVKDNVPDLLLLDLNMPRMNGFEVIQWIRADKKTRFLPIIVLTAYGQEKIPAFEFGADDFLEKPFDKTELFVRIKAHLRIKDSIENLEDAENVIMSLARLVEARDPYTEEHTERVADISIKLGEKMGLDEDMQLNLKRGAVLHDIGKIGIKESILNKNGPLNKEERKHMEKHPIIGEEICRPLETFKDVLPIIRHHHERWDGKGYPDGLKGEEIPLLARIVTAADVFDALISNRPYRDAWPRERALGFMKKEAGTQFDPSIIEFLLEIIK